MSIICFVFTYPWHRTYQLLYSFVNSSTLFNTIGLVCLKVSKQVSPRLFIDRVKKWIALLFITVLPSDTAATTAKKPGSLPSPTSSTSSMTTALMMEDQMSRHHGLGGIEGGGGSPTAAFQFCYQDHLSPFSSSTALQSHHFHHHHNSSSGGHYHNGSLAAMLPVETINSGGAVLHQYSSSNEVHPVQSTRFVKLFDLFFFLQSLVL